MPGWSRGQDSASAHALRRPGAPPGIEHLPGIAVAPVEGEIRIHVFDYAPAKVEEHALDPTDLEAWLAAPIPEWVTVRWINVDGLNPWVVERFRRALGFHALAAEDVLHIPQRPALERFPDHLFIKARLLQTSDELLVAEQVSIFVFDRVLLTFQEREGDVWEPVRARIRLEESSVRQRPVGFLMYALLDAAVDHVFPLLERCGDALEDLEDAVMEKSDPKDLQRVQQLRRELVAIRRILWPTRELLDMLGREETKGLSDHTRTYLRDVYSHVVQALDIVEAQRDMCSGLTDLYMSQASNRMNEVMKVLTVMASLFIPVTFLAGVYGMNFRVMPELGWQYGYAAFWGLCALTVVGLLWFFRRRGWW